ncbi:MAG TPA: hypothetical protein VGH29_09515, partial [Candidatus Binataceae bacterium]
APQAAEKQLPKSALHGCAFVLNPEKKGKIRAATVRERSGSQTAARSLTRAARILGRRSRDQAQGASALRNFKYVW